MVYNPETRDLDSKKKSNQDNNCIRDVRLSNIKGKVNNLMPL